MRRVLSARRDGVIEALVGARCLWPLIDHGPSCCLCAAPRRGEHVHGFARCCGCRELASLYDDSLDDLHPLTYTAPRWALCGVVRDLKDVFFAGSDNPLARDIGAILSAYLEAQLGGNRLGLPRGFDVVTTVPSSRPVIRAALRRADQEGWWVPQLTEVGAARLGHRRQRKRPEHERMYVREKWQLDGTAVDGLDVLVLDDLYTSGGSVHSFAQALRRAGANSVRAVVLARNLGADAGDWALPLLCERQDAVGGWTPRVNKHDVLSRSSPPLAGSRPAHPRRRAGSACLAGGTRRV